GGLRLRAKPPADGTRRRSRVADELLRKTLEEEEFLVRRMRGEEEAHAVGVRRSSGREPLGELCRRLAPGDRVVNAGIPHERRTYAIVAFDPVIPKPADVAHPVVVHFRVEPWREADQARALRPLRLRLDPRRHVAAARALGADRVDGLRVVPGARLEAVVARRDRAD